MYQNNYNDVPYLFCYEDAVNWEKQVRPIKGKGRNAGIKPIGNRSRTHFSIRTHSLTEHGVLIGTCSARADITYSQGLNRLFDRTTRYDYLYPILQNIGDQATLIKELYCQDPATDTGATGTPDNERTFNYQERYAELKYKPSWVTGLFRPNATQSLESWILTQEFSSLPSFDQTFIESSTPMDRAIATPSEPHLILDCYFNLQCARPMHMYSIPGMGQRF